MDTFGQSIWQQTTTSIHRNTVYEITTVDPVGGTPTGTDTGTTTSTSPAQDTANPLGQAIDYASTAWGFDFAPLFGMILLLAIALGAAKASSGNTLIIGLVAFVGFIGLVFMGLLPRWSLIVAVFIIIWLASSALFGGGGDE
jgi:hypothetical protein